MDNFFNHVAPLPRRFARRLRVETIGYIARKRDWVRQAFPTFNFSFVLSGTGRYQRDGVWWPVVSPCVITQWPGEHMVYGPGGKSATWDELFLVYEGELTASFLKQGYVTQDRPVWSIDNRRVVRQKVAELATLLQNLSQPGMADRVDQTCETLIMESLLGEAKPPREEEAQVIDRVRAQFDRDFAEAHDLDALARQHAMTPSTFRRYWMRQVGMPPGRYVLQRRVTEACRLLVETPQPIGQIAMRVGFSDPLYFSRRFRDEMGMTASAYRKAHRAPLLLDQFAKEPHE